MEAKYSLRGKISGAASLSGKNDFTEIVKGDSAYESAVKNGFEGSEEEWLESLKGENGSTPYIQDGYWYIDGVNTNVKATGIDGKDGINGKDGNSIKSIKIVEVT